MLSQAQQTLQEANMVAKSSDRLQGPENPAVRTPNFPVGSSVEFQVTGHDSIGGIQLYIIPEHDTSWMSVSNVSHACKTGQIHTQKDYELLDALKTPMELGYKDGDTLHIKI